MKANQHQKQIKVSVSISILIMTLFTGSVLGQKSEDAKERREEYKKERQLQRIDDKHKKKVNKRYMRKTARQYSRRVWELTYDAESRELVSSELILSDSRVDSVNNDTIQFPPSEVHEYDGVKVKFTNLNPFMYRTKLIEVQSDRINSEELSSYEYQVGAAYSVKPITQLKIVKPTIPSPDATYAQTLTSIDSLSTRLVQNKGTFNKLLSGDSLYVTEQLFKIFEKNDVPADSSAIKNSILDDSVPSSLPNGSEPTKIFPYLSEPTRRLLVAYLIKLDDTIKLQSETLADLQSKFSTAMLENIDTSEVGQSKSFSSASLRVSSDKMIALLEEINRFIYFHNQFVNVFNLPENKYSKINIKRIELQKTIYPGQNLETIFERFAKSKMNFQSELIELQNTLRFIQNSKIFNENDVNYDLGAYDQALKDLSLKVSEINFGEMIKRIRDLNSLLSEENFTLTYQSLDITENADFKSIQVEFEQIKGADVPKGRGNFKFNMGFMIREGVKIDITPTIMFESGLVPSDYYFEPDPNNPGFAQVIKEKNEQNALGAGVLLNVYKRSGANFKLGGSAGFGISQNVEPRFSLGPTLIIGRKERAVISAGAIFGQTTQPKARYQTDELVEVNDDILQAGVPLENGDIGVGYYIGVGFNLFSAKNKEVFNNGYGRFSPYP